MGMKVTMKIQRNQIISLRKRLKLCVPIFSSQEKP